VPSDVPSAVVSSDGVPSVVVHSSADYCTLQHVCPRSACINIIISSIITITRYLY
jgi:hypothetical protein